jgi:hypothetical protein
MKEEEGEGKPGESERVVSRMCEGRGYPGDKKAGCTDRRFGEV